MTSSFLGNEHPENDLLYADTEIHEVLHAAEVVTIRGIGFMSDPLTRHFNGATVLHYSSDGIERVENGRLVKLQNGMRRLSLFDDDSVLFLEIEFRNCECGKTE